MQVNVRNRAQLLSTQGSKAPLAAEWNTELSVGICSYKLPTSHPPPPSRQKEKYASHQTWILEMLWCSSKAGASLCAPPMHKENVIILSRAYWAEPQPVNSINFSSVSCTHWEMCLLCENREIQQVDWHFPLAFSYSDSLNLWSIPF